MTNYNNIFAQHINHLETMKALAFKYASTQLELSSIEWAAIKTNRIDERYWSALDMTSDEYYNYLIEMTQNVIQQNQLKSEDACDHCEGHNADAALASYCSLECETSAFKLNQFDN